MSEYVNGGNVATPARKRNGIFSYLIIFLLIFGTSSAQNLQKFLASTASGAALSTQENSTMLKTVQEGSFLPALPYLLLSFVSVGLIFLVVRYVAPSIITLLLQTPQRRRSTIIFCLGVGLVLGFLNTNDAVGAAGRYRANTWLETNHIATDNIDMPNSGIGTIQVKTDEGKTKTLHYNLNDEKINLSLTDDINK